MKVDVTQILTDYQGKDLTQGPKKEKLELRSVISTAVNTMNLQGEKSMTSEEKNKAYQISTRVWSKKEVDFTVEQLAFIKEKVGKVYNPLVYGRICDIIEKKK